MSCIGIRIPGTCIQSSGVFVTEGSAENTPEERIDALALPASNSAQYKSQIVLTRDQVLLEGRVRGQNESVFSSDDRLSRSGGGWQIVTVGGRYTGAIRYL